MAYGRTVGQDHPGLFVFVLDQSGSMGSNWPGNTASAEIKKAQFLSDIINKVIREIGANAVYPGGLKHRCDIGLIGYEGAAAYSLWTGKLAGRDVVGIPEIIDNPHGTLTVKEQRPDPVEGVVEVDRKYDYWIEPTAGGNTPMGQALQRAYDIVNTWLHAPNHQDSFPPIIIHVTDGMPNSNERQMAISAAEAIKTLSTSDGHALLFTIHIPDSFGQTILFPSSQADLPAQDESAKLLYDMASVLPQELLETALGAGLAVKQGSRLMIMNADALAVSKLITWGSSSGGAIQPKELTPL